MKRATKQVRKAALALVRDSRFLYRVNQKLGEMGIIGEEKNRLTLFLAGLTKDLDKSVSVLMKGPSASGKNNSVRRGVQLFPPECVITRSSLSAKALAHGAAPLSGKIFYLQEYRGGRDAQYFTRELQSEGFIEHEHTVVSGKHKTTHVAKRIGDPVFLSTTTELQVFADDETRFLSLRADESEELTRAVILSKFKQVSGENEQPIIEVWHEAIRILTDDPPQFRYPSWFEFLGEQIPAQQTRARRDADRFLSLLKAVALCRSFSDGRRERKDDVKIRLGDYAVAYEILNEAFSFTYRGTHPQALKVAEAVRDLYDKEGTPITTKAVAKHLGWEAMVTYKWIDVAIDAKLIGREEGTHEKNQKRLIPRIATDERFLPHPALVLREGQNRIERVRYIDPLSGGLRTLRE